MSRSPGGNCSEFACEESSNSVTDLSKASFSPYPWCTWVYSGYCTPMMLTFAAQQKGNSQSGCNQSFCRQEHADRDALGESWSSCLSILYPGMRAEPWIPLLTHSMPQMTCTCGMQSFCLHDDTAILPTGKLQGAIINAMMKRIMQHHSGPYSGAPLISKGILRV